LLGVLTAEQISEWMAYDKLEPIGKKRDEYGWAQICSTMENIVRNLYRKKGETPKLTTPLDFMPNWGGLIVQEKKKGQSVEEMKQVLLSTARIHNRKIEKKNG